MRKRILNTISKQKILFVLSILINIVLTIIIFATINEKQIYTYFNSDTLYLPSIYKDLFIDKSGFAGWHLNGAPNFLPDMLLFFIIRGFFSNFIPACFTFSIVQLVIMLILLSVLYKSIFKKINYVHLSFATLLMSLFLMVTLVNDDFIYTFYLLSISYHLGSFIMFLISFIILFRYLQSGKNNQILLLFIVTILSIINDRLFLILFSFPVYAFIFILFLKPARKAQIYKILIYNTASILIGLFLFRMLSLSGYIHFISLSWKVFNFSNIIPALNIFVEQHLFYIKEFDFRGIIDLLFLISFFIHLFLLTKKMFMAFKKKISHEIEILYLLLFCASVFLVLITPIINGNYVSWALFRYNIYSLYIGVFSSGYLIYKLSSKAKFLSNYLSIIVVIFLVAQSIAIFSLINKNNIAKGLNDFMHYYPEEVECIDKLSQENNLRYGVAEYWDAKYITMFSKQNVRVYTVLDHLGAWYHVTNQNWFYNDGKGKYANPDFNFVITERLNKANIGNQLGIPKDTLNCATGLEIYIYPEFEFDKKTRKPLIKE